MQKESSRGWPRAIEGKLLRKLVRGESPSRYRGGEKKRALLMMNWMSRINDGCRRGLQLDGTMIEEREPDSSYDRVELYISCCWSDKI